MNEQLNKLHEVWFAFNDLLGVMGDVFICGGAARDSLRGVTMTTQRKPNALALGGICAKKFEFFHKLSSHSDDFLVIRGIND
jgi:hypothetical protein